MNDYTGKVCPFCKTEIKPTDEIVVCSDCDMPHHKDCWIENQGCTTFGCLGTIKAADNAATSVTSGQINYEEIKSNVSSAVVYCTKCGAQNSVTSSFCSKCGNRLTTSFKQEQSAYDSTQANHVNNNHYTYENQQNNYSANGYTNYQSYQNPNVDSDVQQFIGTKGEYYIPKFQELKLQNKKTSWNWAAFLFTGYWMIYRKMYGYGAGLLGVVFLLTLIGSNTLSLLLLVGYIIIGIYGNNIYMNFLEKKANQANEMTEPYKTQFIMKNSGVNTTAAVLTAIGYALILAFA